MVSKPCNTEPDEGPADEATGWHAIDAACNALYPDQPEPLHVAAVPHPPLGGDGLIYGISIYRAEKPRHWHFVTYGFSELYAKESDDPAVSGWGFELTFRLMRGENESQPPAFAINFLMNLGRYVRRSRNPFGTGHYMDLNGPIGVGADTAIRAIAFVEDPQLGAIDTPNGRVQFLQVVGITTDEMAACGDWQPQQVLDLLRERDLLLVTDLARRSLLEDPALASRVEEGIDREGSVAWGNFVSLVDWAVDERAKTARVVLGAKGVLALLPKLRSRLAHGRPFVLIGHDKRVDLRPAEASGWEAEDERLWLDLTEATVRAMRASLQAKRGTYQWKEFPGFTLEVRPSEVTDSEGRVIEVIG
jgi:hypothetical protein